MIKCGVDWGRNRFFPIIHPDETARILGEEHLNDF